MGDNDELTGLPPQRGMRYARRDASSICSIRISLFRATWGLLMKVAIDATTLLLPSAGVKNYIHYWLAALRGAAARQPNTRIATYPPYMTAPDVIDHQKSFRNATSARFQLGVVQFCNIRRNPSLGLLVSGADVFHASQHVASRPRKTKTTATVFDMSCWITPAVHTPENIEATRRYAEKILKRCDGLIAISAHARQDVVEILGIPGERIRVIYPGIADAFFEVTPDQVAACRNKFDLPLRYLLFVGCIEPRKNVPNMIRAYQQLPDSLRREVPLVIAGPRGWASKSSFDALTAAGASVRYLGYVAETILPGLVSGAAALIYPSYYEGFGLPAAQAMAAGVPVIASDRSCLPEVVGDAGLLIDPDAVEEMGHAMQRVLNDAELARTLAARGRKRGATFRWSRCAEESLDFFRDVAGE